ncbi:ATP-dependent DNA helicase sgs1 [Puccinia graminis f. sp. tritici]|uniref:DNA 3'-5' helicase n=1 Tax=Puccinia graminis f. sp. tritici TaxID=56615 RepID=A0A5B0PAM8_PUCGR|nr:ATP-dependent DNA helicase sgs1 [Puccinia graminis f. sp. tritici]KAA1098657.1 ATP-dependent DNA helicase sgs1 [Puccinia graminis f. sp. tritici]
MAVSKTNRTQSPRKSGRKSPPKTDPKIKKTRQTSGGSVTVTKKLLRANDDSLKIEIATKAAEFYDGQEAKTLQIQAVANLVRGRNTFLLAGTGYGKSRIPEIYHKLLPQERKPVVIVLNPLDALGDNQVEEKKGKFSAINLTKLTFNKTVANKIQKGDFNFVYLSPEIFMNNKMWDSVYFSSEFQERLALVVVDEAHMIYLWGLVERDGRRTASIFVRLEDIGIFRPYYGQLATHLQCRNNSPILMLSATCRPVAVDAILKNLKLTKELIDIIEGELTRTEIRILRINMTESLQSNLDLKNIFPLKEKTSDQDIVPTLIYSGTRARTLTVLEVLDMARGTPGGCLNPDNTLARRFHSCTGDKDKVSCIEGYSQGSFPIISATMALGLGQNWKRVRCVIHMGRADPANVSQMIGRCGRDGRDGLAILFVEPNRKGGKNSEEDFSNPTDQSDDDRMDALAITSCCLRVAFAMDNKLGYIPLSKDDPDYVKEVEHERTAGFPPCKCSNCAVVSGQQLVENLRYLTKENFESAMDNTLDFPPPDSNDAVLKKNQTRRAANAALGTENDQVILARFKADMITSFHQFYEAQMGCSARFSASSLFHDEHADTLLENLDEIQSAADLYHLIGGEVICGQLEFLYDLIGRFKENDLYQEHLDNQERLREENEEKKKTRKKEAAARYRANRRMRLLAAKTHVCSQSENMPSPPSSTIDRDLEITVDKKGIRTTRNHSENMVVLHATDTVLRSSESMVNKEETRKQRKREADARYRAKKKAQRLGGPVKESESINQAGAAVVDSTVEANVSNPMAVSDAGLDAGD